MICSCDSIGEYQRVIYPIRSSMNNSPTVKIPLWSTLIAHNSIVWLLSIYNIFSSWVCWNLSMVSPPLSICQQIDSTGVGTSDWYSIIIITLSTVTDWTHNQSLDPSPEYPLTTSNPNYNLFNCKLIVAHPQLLPQSQWMESSIRLAHIHL